MIEVGLFQNRYIFYNIKQTHYYLSPPYTNEWCVTSRDTMQTYPNVTVAQGQV